ncbi:MAG TPA: helix-turn-helix transcriptional regulator [Gemmatimonadaceae bacterium]|jgi:hypothetical protein|nr:helix-turn-helix transcriptional regulator [Gemmatimonadaceae bacterium]
MPIRLRVPELLAERQMTPYKLHKLSGGRISLGTAYRLGRQGEFKTVSRTVLEALRDVFELEHIEPFFTATAVKKGGKGGSGE